MERFTTDAKVPDEVGQQTEQGITIRIENVTFKAQPIILPSSVVEVIDLKEIAQ